MRISDWSSDVCSSDLWHRFTRCQALAMLFHPHFFFGGRLFGQKSRCHCQDRKRVVQGKSVAGRVDSGGCRIIKKKSSSYLLYLCYVVVARWLALIHI